MIKKSVFFVGIGGSGMNAIARIMHHKGFNISGSDREFDAGRRADFYSEMVRSGIRLYPQNGSGIHNGLAFVVASTAIESSIPDVSSAKRMGIPIIHRSQALAGLLKNYSSISIAGTSGKSTVTGMGAWALKRAGYDPTVVNGARILGIGPSGGDTDHLCGNGIWAMYEADESDGSLTRFHPDIGLLTNISKDHKPLPELLDIFECYSQNINDCLIYNANCSDSRLVARCAKQAISFGYDHNADFQITQPHTSGMHSECVIEGHRLRLDMPGLHNIENASAIFTLLRYMGHTTSESIEALQGFCGVERRFQVIGTVNRITVIDDFAHNPDKIRATMSIARNLSHRVVYIYQPHGYGPTKFLFYDLIEQFSSGLRLQDMLIVMPIFYAGGAAEKTVSSDDLVRDIIRRGRNALIAVREQLSQIVPNNINPGDIIVVMGARDPSLPELCHSILSDIAKNFSE
jgi:UDP-N-acetylmuramate--alanine ligase